MRAHRAKNWAEDRIVDHGEASNFNLGNQNTDLDLVGLSVSWTQLGKNACSATFRHLLVSPL